MNKLQDTWNFWAHRQSDSSSYKNNTLTIATVNTVEDFWRIFNNLPLPSTFFYDGNSRYSFQDKVGSVFSVTAFSMFKDGIHPSWEDPINKKGGDFSFRNFNDLLHLDQCWENCLLDCIGEHHKGTHSVVGVRVVDSSHKHRQMYKLEVWYKNREETVRSYILGFTDDEKLSEPIHKKHSS